LSIKLKRLINRMFNSILAEKLS